MKKKAVQHHIDALAALLLLAVFAVCVLAVLLTGSSAYHRLTLRDQAAGDRRSCCQYLATRVRQSDTLGGVAVEEFHGQPSLVLDADAEYITRVYYYDGFLWELYCAADDPDFLPEDGERIIEAGGLELSLEGGLLHITVESAQGSCDELYLALRSGEEAQP